MAIQSKADFEVITVGKIKQAAPKREGKPISVLKVSIKPILVMIIM